MVSRAGALYVATTMTTADIRERGNGFPGLGAYVQSEGGTPYRVVACGSRIEIDARDGAVEGRTCPTMTFT